MGKAFECDRCGEHGSSPAKRLWDLHGGHGHAPLPHAKKDGYYLCSDCAEEFKQFMSGEK